MTGSVETERKNLNPFLGGQVTCKVVDVGSEVPVMHRWL